MADDRTAHTFLLQGIQHWGQTAEQREKATRAYVEAAGLTFGSEEANEWLDGTLKNLRRGEFNSEVRQLQEALADRQAGLMPSTATRTRYAADTDGILKILSEEI